MCRPSRSHKWIPFSIRACKVGSEPKLNIKLENLRRTEPSPERNTCRLISLSESWVLTSFSFKPRNSLPPFLLILFCTHKIYLYPPVMQKPYFLPSIQYTFLRFAINNRNSYSEHYFSIKHFIPALPFWWIQSLWLGKWSWKHASLQSGELLRATLEGWLWKIIMINYLTVKRILAGTWSHSHW